MEINFDLGNSLQEHHGGLNSLNSFNSCPEKEKAFPEPDAAIYHGLPGDIVRVVEPHTEADPVALHIQIMAAFGNVIGRGAHFEVEADRHHANLFVCIAGATSKGRKGVSGNHALRPFQTIDSAWNAERVMGGLSSAEGLIYAVRDEVKKGDIVIDEGVKDKRLLVNEPELVSVLKQASREGNTLSACLRQAWDGKPLRTLTKNSPMKATDTHISNIGHITVEELLRHLTATDTANGFANRFLFILVKRSKCLPRGGEIYRVNFEPLIKRLREAINFSKNAGRIEPTEEAWAIWEGVYPELSEGRPGLLGAVTSRAEAQTMRLAMIYALMDSSLNIRPEHLLAALALWDYSFQSAQYIFGDSLGNPIADDIFNALKNNPEGLTRTDISNYFGRNKKSADIQQSLESLHLKGLISKTSHQTGGRAMEIWTTKETNYTKKGKGVVL